MNRLVIFEGADATGKSYLSNKFLVNNPEYEHFYTPHILRDVVKNDKSLSNFTRQIVAAASHYDMLEQYSKHDFIVQDRSFISSIVYYILQEGLAREDYMFDENLLRLMEIYYPIMEYLAEEVSNVDVNIVWRNEPIGRYNDESDKDVFTVELEKWRNIKQIYEDVVATLIDHYSLHLNFTVNLIENTY